MIRQRITIGIIFLCLILFPLKYSYSSDEEISSDDITGDAPVNGLITGLETLSCETMADYQIFVNGEFKNTCITYPMFDILIGSIIYFDTYPGVVGRLRINDMNLFGIDQCSLDNRANPFDPRLQFGMCSNVKIFAIRVQLFQEAALDLLIAFGSGNWDNFWSTMDKIVMGGSPGSQDSYYKDMFEMFDTTVGDNDTFWDMPLGTVSFRMPWKVYQYNDSICMGTIGIFGELAGNNQYIAVGCKYMKEPYPESIYSSLIDGSESTSGDSASVKCSNMGQCYKEVLNNARSLKPMSSIIVYCLNEMLIKAILNPDVCSIEDADKSLVDKTSYSKSILYQFQDNMKSTVSILLTFYVMIFGFRMLYHAQHTRSEGIMFALKIILVFYFAVGVHSSDNQHVGGNILLPWIFSWANALASIMMSFQSGELCDFSDQTYAQGYEFLRLWDSLDCRVSHYLGIDVLTEFYAENFKQEKNWAKIASLSYPIPFYAYLLTIGLYTGMSSIVQVAIAYPIMIIAVATFLVQSFVTASILIMILGTLSPIFVPMVLFNRTKPYFQHWLQLIISSTLQPMIATSFIIMMFAVYDHGFYGSCKYKASDISTPHGSGRVFTLETDPSQYSDADFKSCSSSLGYMMDSPLSAIFHKASKGGSVDQDAYLSAATDSATFDSKTEDDPVLAGGAVQKEKGIFLDFFEIIFHKIVSIMIALLTAIIVLYLMYYLSDRLSELLTSLSMGVDLGLINPKSMIDTTIKFINYARSIKMSDFNFAGNNNSNVNQDGANEQANHPGASPSRAIGSPASASGPSRGSVSPASASGPIPSATSASGPIPSASSASGPIPSDTRSESEFKNTVDSPPPIGLKSTPVDIQFGDAKNNDASTIRSSMQNAMKYSDAEAFNRPAGSTEEEFSRYISLIANDSLYEKHVSEIQNGKSAENTRFSKVKDAYKSTLERYVNNNKSADSIDEIALKLEKNLGGAGANRLRQINNEVLDEMGIERVKTLKDIED
jgi:type IV secretion system protein VirB6